MALAAATQFEVRTTGSDNNGGGFVEGASGTDRSQQDAAHATLTAASTVHTTTTQINVAVGDYTVTAADVGNLLQITGGTATAGFYQITAVDVGNNRWTVDRSAGTSEQTVVGSMGGALASPGKAAGPVVNGNFVWVKKGTYTLTTASTNVSNGPISLGLGFGVRIKGYNLTRGDLDGVLDDTNKPVISAGSITGVTIVNNDANDNNNPSVTMSLVADGNNGANNTGFGATTARSHHAFCTAKRCTTIGFTGGKNCYFCRATDCAIGFGNIAAGLFYCEAINSTNYGFWCTGPHIYGCVARGSTNEGFVVNGSELFLSNCTAVGNGNDGFDVRATGTVALLNCVSTHNGAWGYDLTQPGRKVLVNCAGFSNTSGNVSGTPRENVDFKTLSIDPWVNRTAGDLRPNNTSGGGASLRAFGDGAPSQLNNLDIGAVQHADPAGGGLIHEIGPG